VDARHPLSNRIPMLIQANPSAKIEEAKQKQYTDIKWHKGNSQFYYQQLLRKIKASTNLPREIF